MYQDNSTPQKQDLLKTIIVPRNLKGLLLPKSKYEDKESKDKDKELKQKEQKEKEQKENEQKEKEIKE